MPVNAPDRATLESAWKASEEKQAFWNANAEALRRAYPDEFVAVSNGSVISHAPDLQQLVVALQERGTNVNRVWLRFIALKPDHMLL